MKFQLIKLSITLIFLLQISLSHAQQGRGGGNNQTAMNSDYKFEFSIENAIGIIRYDVDVLYKKLKVKKEDNKRILAKKITEYNRKIDKIKFLNSVLLNDVNTFIEVKKMEASMNKDMQLMKSAKVQAQDKLNPIKAKITIEDENLNSQLKKILSKKQFKKWKKHHTKRKEALKPKALVKNRVNAAKAGAQRNNYNRRRRSY